MRREEPHIRVSARISLAVVHLCRSLGCEDELAITPAAFDRARQVDPLLTVPVSEERVESFDMHGKQIGGRRSGPERGQPQRPGANRRGCLKQDSDIEGYLARRRASEGRLCSIPGGMKGTFTPSYRVKVPFMRSRVG